MKVQSNYRWLLCLFFLLYLVARFDEAIGQTSPEIRYLGAIRKVEDTDSLYFDEPVAVNIDEDGNVYVCDRKANRIFKFDRELNLLWKSGKRGFGEGKFDQPVDIQVDKEGLIYIADSRNRTIQVLNGEGDFVRIIGESGREAGKIREPTSIAVDRYGTIFVLDQRNRRIVKMSVEGDYLDQMDLVNWSGGKRTIREPVAIAVDVNQCLYILDRNPRRIWKFDGNFKLISFNPIDLYACEDPVDIAVNDCGELFVTNNGEYVLWWLDEDGNVKLKYKRSEMEFFEPRGVCVGNNRLLMTDLGGFIVRQFELRGAKEACPASKIVPKIHLEQEFDFAIRGLPLKTGDFLQVDNNKLIMIDPSGKKRKDSEFKHEKKEGYKRVDQLILIDDNLVCFTDSTRRLVYCYDLHGVFRFALGKDSDGRKEMAIPSGIAISKDGEIVVSDRGTASLRVYLMNQSASVKTVSTIAIGNPKIFQPDVIKVDSEGNMFVLGLGNPRYVQKFNPEFLFVDRFSLTVQDPEMGIDSRIGTFTLDEEDNLILYNLDTQKVEIKWAPNYQDYTIFSLPEGFEEEEGKPVRLLVDARNHVYVSSEKEERTYEYAFQKSPLPPTSPVLYFDSEQFVLEWRPSHSRYVESYEIVYSTDSGQETSLFEVADTTFYRFTAVPDRGGSNLSFSILSVTGNQEKSPLSRPVVEFISDGLSAGETGDHATAVRQFTSAIHEFAAVTDDSSDVRLAHLFYLRGMSYRAQSQAGNAAKDFRLAYDLRPDRGSYLLALLEDLLVDGQGDSFYDVATQFWEYMKEGGSGGFDYDLLDRVMELFKDYDDMQNKIRFYEDVFSACNCDAGVTDDLSLDQRWLCDRLRANLDLVRMKSIIEEVERSLIEGRIEEIDQQEFFGVLRSEGFSGLMLDWKCRGYICAYVIDNNRQWLENIFRESCDCAPNQEIWDTYFSPPMIANFNQERSRRCNSAD